MTNQRQGHAEQGQRLVSDANRSLAMTSLSSTLVGAVPLKFAAEPECNAVGDHVLKPRRGRGPADAPQAAR